MRGKLACPIKNLCGENLEIRFHLAARLPNQSVSKAVECERHDRPRDRTSFDQRAYQGGEFIRVDHLPCAGQGCCPCFPAHFNTVCVRGFHHVRSQHQQREECKSRG